MSDLRFTDTNSSDDSAGRAFGLDGNLYLPAVAAVIIAVGIFAGLGLLGIPRGLAGGIAAAPVTAVGIWIALFKHGKPAGHDRDCLDQFMGGGDFTKEGAAKNDTLSHAHAPEGRLAKGMMIFGTPERGGLASRGFLLTPPDLRGGSIDRLNTFQDQVRSVLAVVTPGRRLQVQWWVDSDYRKELVGYNERTQATANPKVRAVRNERFVRYWSRMTIGGLRREHLAIFLSIEISARPGTLRGRERLAGEYNAILDELAGQFDEFAVTLGRIFGGETEVRSMDDREHASHLSRFLNPSLSRHDRSDAEFDPALTIQENCWHGEGVGRADGGFTLDGQFHAILALSRWPQRTRPGIVTHLTGLPFLDYRITVNLTPVPVRREISREEKVAERLRGEYAEKPRASLLVALRKKERKVEALSGGFARPFQVTYLIRVWAPSLEELREKVAAVQSAINAMDGAQYFECAMAVTAMKLFFASWPGWTHSAYRHRELYGEDAYLADVLPFSSTFTGTVDAEALYDGSHGNLVGVATQAGGSPQHAVVFGMTGAGKSAFIEDLLLQTGEEFGHTLLIEEGLSYRRFTESFGETPIVIHPDSALTLNYLDTQGLPLTQLHLATAVALLARMIGGATATAELALRQAQLAQYLQQLYRDSFVEWSRRNPTQAMEARRFACAVHQWRERMPGNPNSLEAFMDLRDQSRANEAPALEAIARPSEHELTRFEQEPATARLVAQTACAFYKVTDFPTHAALVDLLAFARLPEHGKDDIDRLATLLRAWTAEGQYGRLFDGPTNVSLQRKVVHFELGLIPEQAVELKTAAGLLVGGLGRQHILALDRGVRKRILFEELARFLDTPGGEQIVAEGYAQLRKHNCLCVSVVQQYSRFKESRVRGAVIGNAKQFFFMRQADRADLVDLAKDLPLPESALEAIQRYPLPEQLPAEKQHSSLCYFTPTTQPPQCGTLRHFQEKPCDPAA